MGKRWNSAGGLLFRRVRLLCLLALAGCAAHTTWAPGPGLTVADFEPAKARCSLMARHGGGDFAAYGSPSFVAGASLGNAIGQAARARQDFDDCMTASGWRRVDGQYAVAASATATKLKVVSAERLQCVNEVRSEPQFAVLQSKLSNVHTGSFTMEQLTNEELPTPAESRLMAAYIDNVKPCLTTAVNAISQIAPAVAPILQQQISEEQDTMIQLVERKISWGAAAQRETQDRQDVKAKLSQGRM